MLTVFPPSDHRPRRPPRLALVAEAQGQRTERHRGSHRGALLGCTASLPPMAYPTSRPRRRQRPHTPAGPTGTRSTFITAATVAMTSSSTTSASPVLHLHPSNHPIAHVPPCKEEYHSAAPRKAHTSCLRDPHRPRTPLLRLLTCLSTPRSHPPVFVLSALQAGPWHASYHPQSFYAGARSPGWGG